LPSPFPSRLQLHAHKAAVLEGDPAKHEQSLDAAFLFVVLTNICVLAASPRNKFTISRFLISDED